MKAKHMICVLLITILLSSASAATAFPHFDTKWLTEWVATQEIYAVSDIERKTGSVAVQYEQIQSIASDEHGIIAVLSFSKPVFFGNQSGITIINEMLEQQTMEFFHNENGDIIFDGRIYNNLYDLAKNERAAEPIRISIITIITNLTSSVVGLYQKIFTDGLEDEHTYYFVTAIDLNNGELIDYKKLGVGGEYSLYWNFSLMDYYRPDKVRLQN